MPLEPYRRHQAECDHKDKGQHFSLCSCPIWVYGELPNGERIRQSLRTSDWARAQARVQLLVRGEAGAFLADAGTARTLGTAIEAYASDTEKRKLKGSTRSNNGQLFVHLKAFFGVDFSLSAITVPMLDSFRKSRVRKLKDGETRPIMPRTQNKEIKTMRTFFAWCLDRDWVVKNPAKKLRMAKEEDVATLPLERDEVERMILACGQIASDNPAETAYVCHHARALVYVLLYSGLRISDVTCLRRAALDVESRYLTLRVTKTGVRLKVQLHPDAVRCLDTLPSTNPEYFFWSGNGDLNTLRKNLTRTIYRLGKLANVKARPHRFRDTFAVELLEQGADIRTVQLLLGHQSVKTTEKHYAHFMPSHQKLLDSATAKLDFTSRRRPVLVKALGNRRRNA